MYQEPYKKLIVWDNLCTLRREVFIITKNFNGNFRRIEQMNAAARSAKQNFAEGYKKGYIGQFINFCNISRASLEELHEDIKDCYEDKLINNNDYKKLYDLSKKTMYLLDKYIKSLFKMKNNNTWRNRK
ncbi:MAG: four helix bundle protein [Patescibacteria group bacterium]